MSLKDITISTEGWSDEEIDNLCEIFPTELTINRRKIAQFTAGIETAIIIYIVGSGILGGFLGAIGTDVWNKLKGKFLTRVKENKNSSLSFEIRDGSKSRKFNLKTDDSSLVEKAFDTMSEVLEKNANDTESRFFFDEKNQAWIKIEESKFKTTVRGIGVTTGPIKKGDKTYKIPLEVLQKSAPSLVGVPITIGHGGKEIGKITKAWVEDDKLLYEGGIYETATEEDIETLNRISKTGGVSISMTYFDELLEEV